MPFGNGCDGLVRKSGNSDFNDSEGIMRIARDREAEQIAGMYQTKYDHAGKKYLERPDENTLGSWLLTAAAVIVCALMILSPILIPMLWPN